MNPYAPRRLRSKTSSVKIDKDNGNERLVENAPMVPSKTFGVVADLKRGIAVRGAILCPMCDGDGELPGICTAIDLNPQNRCCDECGGQGWCPDDVED